LAAAHRCYDQQRFEADLRYSLVRFRENAEGIALYHGEPTKASSAASGK
jgi:putative ATP-binding cassette transporter